MCIARYTLAVDRRTKEGGADFISVVAFGKAGEFAEKYLHKGTKIVLTGRIQTGSYTNSEKVRVYTTDVVAEDQEFAESKAAAAGGQEQGNAQTAVWCTRSNPADGNGFMNIPPGLDEELPFN